jgi:hypothetical protein
MRKSLYSLGCLLLLALLGCEQIIPIELPEHTPVLVVNATFTPDSVWKAQVTSSQSIQVLDPPMAVNNATVLILENGVVVDTLTYTIGHYTSLAGRKPVADRVYTVRATAPGFAETIGTDRAPIAVAPFDITWEDSTSGNPNEGWYGDLSFTVDDPAGADNYYALSVLRIDSYIEFPDTYVYISPVYVQLQDPIMEYDIHTNAVLFQDETFDGNRRVLTVQLSQYERESGQLFFALSTVSESYFKYMQTLSSYSETAFNPFAEPVRVHSNMTPGMGIFAGFSNAFALVP